MTTKRLKYGTERPEIGSFLGSVAEGHVIAATGVATCRQEHDELVLCYAGRMGAWGIEPWQNDPAQNWFDEMFSLTGLAGHIEETLSRTVDDYADEIRAAAFVLLTLGKEVWPTDAYARCATLARLRLTEMLERRVFTNPAFVESVQQQLARLGGGHNGTSDSEETKLP